MSEIENKMYDSLCRHELAEKTALSFLLPKERDAVERYDKVLREIAKSRFGVEFVDLSDEDTVKAGDLATLEVPEAERAIHRLMELTGKILKSGRG